METLAQPHFRVFFAIQQAVLWQQTTCPNTQVFARTSFPSELRLPGSFSSFVVIIKNLMQLAERSYQNASTNKVIFVTADISEQKLVTRITAGGNGFQFAKNALLSETQSEDHILVESLKIIEKQFLGNFEFKTFPTRGTQAIIKLPIQNDTQNHGTS